MKLFINILLAILFLFQEPELDTEFEPIEMPFHKEPFHLINETLL